MTVPLLFQQCRKFSRDSNSSSSSTSTDSDSPTSSDAKVTGTTVVTSTETKFWEGIGADLRAIIGAGAEKSDRSVVINSQSGVIVVRAMPNELRDVADYLSRTEATVTQQVILEAKIVEVELSDAYQAGINWAAVLRDGNKQYFFGQSAPPGGLRIAPFNTLHAVWPFEIVPHPNTT